MTVPYDAFSVEHKALRAKVEALTRRDGLVRFNGHPPERQVRDRSGRTQVVAGQFDIRADGVAEVPPLLFPLTKVTPTSRGARDIRSCHKSAVKNAQPAVYLGQDIP